MMSLEPLGTTLEPSMAGETGSEDRRRGATRRNAAGAAGSASARDEDPADQTSPDPLYHTDRYRLMTPYTLRI